MVELYSDKTKKLYKKVKAVDYFGLEDLMTKTGRHWCSALTRYYADINWISRKKFHKLVNQFPRIKYSFRRLSVQKLEEF